MSDFFKKQFENYEEQPKPELWESILSAVNRYNTIRRAGKIAAFTASVLVAAGLVALFVANSGGNSVSPETIATKQTSASSNEEAIVGKTTTSDITDVLSAEQTSTPMAQNTVKANKKSAIATVEQQVAEPFAPAYQNAVAKNEENAVQRTVSPVANEKSQLLTTTTKTPDNQIDGQSDFDVVTDNTKKSSKMNDNSQSSSGDSTNIPATGSGLKITIPNAFTPDNDQNENNRYFKVFVNDLNLISDFEISVYSRSGMQVFHSKDINKYWDGRYKGKILPMGAYAYIITYTDDKQEKRIAKGTVTIIR